MMKKILFLLIAVSASSLIFAQEKKETKSEKKVDLSKRVSDHFVFQYGMDNWAGAPDSIRIKGKSRHFNAYFMLDKPFQNNPKFSVAYGIGFGSSNIFFDRNYVNIKSSSTSLPFSRSVPNTDSGYYKKFKLTNIYLEAPVEIRYYSNPENPNNCWKAALGVKIGTLLKTYTKGKDLQNKAGQSVYGAKYIMKEDNKKYMNATRVSLSAKVGWGIYGLHFDYQLSQVIKEGFGAEMHPYSIGLSISGL